MTSGDMGIQLREVARQCLLKLTAELCHNSFDPRELLTVQVDLRQDLLGRDLCLSDAGNWHQGLIHLQIQVFGYGSTDLARLEIPSFRHTGGDDSNVTVVTTGAKVVTQVVTIPGPLKERAG